MTKQILAFLFCFKRELNPYTPLSLSLRPLSPPSLSLRLRHINTPSLNPPIHPFLKPLTLRHPPKAWRSLTFDTLSATYQ